MLGDGGFDFETLAERHAAGSRFKVAPADAGDSAGALCLLVIQSDGKLDFPSLDRELAEAGDRDRQLLFRAPFERKAENSRVLALAS